MCGPCGSRAFALAALIMVGAGAVGEPRAATDTASEEAGKAALEVGRAAGWIRPGDRSVRSPAIDAHHSLFEWIEDNRLSFIYAAVLVAVVAWYVREYANEDFSSQTWKAIDLDLYPHLVVAFPALREHALANMDVDRARLGHDRILENEFITTLADKHAVREDHAKMLFDHYGNIDQKHLKAVLKKENVERLKAVDQLFDDMEIKSDIPHLVQWPKADAKYLLDHFTSSSDEDPEVINSANSAAKTLRDIARV